MAHEAAKTRYDGMVYRRVGRSGLKLPAVSLGLWHNFGAMADAGKARAMLTKAFDLGITHFDLANNYGPPPGSAEERFGAILRSDLAAYRNELIVSTKAGFDMWPGPYGDFGSRKYLTASLDDSLRRMGLDYVDIFYHHRPDPETPLEETMGALDQIVRSGKAIYAGISNYDAEQSGRAAAIARDLRLPLIINQVAYSMFDRRPERDGLPARLDKEGVGFIAFMPLAQGLLTERYLGGMPADSRAAGPSPFFKTAAVSPEKLARVRGLKAIAERRGQTLPQLAIAWVLRQTSVCSALIGASSAEQVAECAGAINGLAFSAEDLAAIEPLAVG